MDETVLRLMKPTERRIFDLLNGGQLVRKRTLLESLPSWSATAASTKKGIDDMTNSLSQHLNGLRRLLKPHGLGIFCQRNGSEENSMYGLTRLMARDQG